MASRHSYAGLHTSTASTIHFMRPRHCYSGISFKIFVNRQPILIKPYKWQTRVRLVASQREWHTLTLTVITKSEKCDVTPKIKIFQIDEVILRDNTLPNPCQIRFMGSDE